MKKYLFVIGVLGGLISCNKICPDFDEKVLNWIPYQGNDVIELYSQLNDSTITISIESVVVTHRTYIKYNTKCGGCGDKIRIRQNNNDFSFQADIRSYGSMISNQKYQIGDTYFGGDNKTYSELEKYIFEEKEYDIVRVFEKTDSKGTFKKLIIAKDIGIIGLIDIYGNTWTLKTNPKIKRHNDSSERKNIVINNESCG